MAYREAFWATVGAAAPVLALAQAVIVPKAMERSIRRPWNEARHTRVRQLRAEIDAYEADDLPGAFKRRRANLKLNTHIFRRHGWSMVSSFGSLGVDTIVFAFAMVSLAAGRNIVPPSGCALLIIMAFCLLVNLTFIAGLEEIDPSMPAPGVRGEQETEV